jgi:hypothetical protein
MFQRSKRKWYLVSLIGASVLLSGCTSTLETSTQVYQQCKYQDNCPIICVGDWMNGRYCDTSGFSL